MLFRRFFLKNDQQESGGGKKRKKRERQVLRSFYRLSFRFILSPLLLFPFLMATFVEPPLEKNGHPLFNSE